MTNIQASELRPGERVCRKDDGTVYEVERIAHIPWKRGTDVRLYAGGQAFRAWEVARCDPLKGWPATR